MKQNKKFYAKGIAYGCTLAMMLAMMTGCSAQPKTQASAASDDSTYVQVTSVDGNTITAEQGEWNGPDNKMDKDNRSADQQRPDDGAFDGKKTDGNPPDGNAKPDGNPPEKNNSSDQTEQNNTENKKNDTAKQSDENSNSDGTEEAQDNTSDSEKPVGQPPQNNGKMGSPFTSNGESISFTVTDDTKIVAQSREGEEEKSLSDITDDSILQIELDSNNQATKITIMPNFGGMGESKK